MAPVPWCCCGPVTPPPARAAMGGAGRRALLLGLVGAAITACAPGPRPRRVVKPLEPRPDVAAADIPMIDFHGHLQRRISAEEIVGYMERSGVARTVLMPLYYGDNQGAVNDGEGTDEQALACARRFPERFVPFVGMQRGPLVNRERWIRPDTVARDIVAEADWKLRSGEFFGMGEIMLRFYPYTTGQGIVAVSDMDYPADSALMRQLADLSARYRAPMVIHCEAEPEAADAMERLLQWHPEAIVVWAHNCGRASAGRIHRWLGRYPNLYADLALMVSVGEGYGTYWPRRTPWMHLVMSPEGVVDPEMAALFEAFPDRFLIGHDRAHARGWIHHPFLSQRWRRFLSQCSPATARRLAWENAERMFAR